MKAQLVEVGRILPNGNFQKPRLKLFPATQSHREPMTPHSMWEALARTCWCPRPVCLCQQAHSVWAQAPEAGQAERKQLRQWKPAGERAVGRADFMGCDPRSHTGPPAQKGPTLGWCSSVTVLKLSMIFDKGLHIFICHWALQIVWLVLAVKNCKAWRSPGC